MQRRDFVIFGAACGLLSATAVAAPVAGTALSLPMAINKSGRLRMLSQRSAKAWLLLVQGVLPERGRSILHQSLASFEQILGELESLQPGDEILISHMEHHSNIVPWQLACQRTGARLRVVPITRSGELRLDEFRALLSPRTRLVAFTAVSNALGTVLPAAEIVASARAVGALVLVDAAQAVPHQRVDVRALDCDFLAFSGHKVYGPTGIGVLWGRESVLREMPPWQGGGDMILTVSFGGTTYAGLPYKFEAGTPNISGAVGLAAAIDYLEGLGIERVHAHEQVLLQRATVALERVPGLTIIGQAAHKAGVISFTLEGVHPHDLGTILDAEGVAVRAGHHCAMPVMEFFDVAATARASFGCYSNDADVEQLVAALAHAREVFG